MIGDGEASAWDVRIIEEAWDGPVDEAPEFVLAVNRDDVLPETFAAKLGLDVIYLDGQAKGKGSILRRRDAMKLGLVD